MNARRGLGNSASDRCGNRQRAVPSPTSCSVGSPRRSAGSKRRMLSITRPMPSADTRPRVSRLVTRGSSRSARATCCDGRRLLARIRARQSLAVLAHEGDPDALRISVPRLAEDDQAGVHSDCRQSRTAATDVPYRRGSGDRGCISDESRYASSQYTRQTTSLLRITVSDSESIQSPLHSTQSDACSRHQCERRWRTS